ncbi:hypothetical protein O3G_MSEX006857 [Manduca sexta]|uniref:Protein KRI1 homolog n=1 Tax=Manduca sexta TaxID=7130 RepID=A0A922CLU3_MANSE|nr:hypothetical protein O3G_MSEX006857 [Manduca sexta]
MPKQKLFDDESDDEIEIKVENEYAKKYNAWREKEERHKLEQKYGDKVLSSDVSVTSDSEDESDEPPEISEETETQFLKTLALLKTKDPRIYDPNFKFFNDEEKKQEKETKTKSFTFEDSGDEDDDDGEIFTIEKKAPEITSTDADKKKQEKAGETSKIAKEGTLKDYLIGKKEHIEDEVEKDLAPLKALWSDPKLNEGEAFLRDYILNKRYLEEGDVGEAGDKVRDDDDLEADEQTVEEQGKFERAYNFRFEEPDDEYLKRFPRTMNYIRPKDDRRSRKRAEVRARKEEEKKRKMEEIARLKALKLKEIQEKIAKIKEVTGNEDLAFEEADVEGDFDPAEHDKRMQAIFNEQYYGEADEHKPVFPDLDQELEIENWDNYEVEHDQTGQEGNEDGPHCEDENFNMDADYDPKQARANLLEEIKSTLGKKRRNRKRKSKLAEILATEKPKFVPTVADKTYSEYMEEYYKMDCEDVIGDLPTRFKYREVVPNDFGLSVEEILLADDKELTQWVPLKKIVKYRPANVEKSEINTYASKAADVSLKRKVLPSLFKDLPEDPDIVVPVEEATKKKKKKKKSKQKDKATTETSETNEIEINEEDNVNIVEQNAESDQANGVVETKDKKKKKKNKHLEDGNDSFVNEDVTAQEKSNKHNDGEDNGSVDNRQTETNEGKKKKKKKHKTGDFAVETIHNEAPSQTSEATLGEDSTKNNLKRKLDNNTTVEEVKKKKKKKNKINADSKNEVQNKKSLNSKFKHKDKFNNKNEASNNPLSNLSDERLKAYGLNPKKYRGYLKYKK